MKPAIKNLKRKKPVMIQIYAKNNASYRKVRHLFTNDIQKIKATIQDTRKRYGKPWRVALVIGSVYIEDIKRLKI